MREVNIEELEYDLEQSERSLTEWRGKMRQEAAKASGQTTAHSMYAFYEREVQRLRTQLHALRTGQR